MSPEHIRIAEQAKEDRERKFSSIAHLLTVEALQEAFGNLRKDASAGVDGVTYTEYAADVRKNLRFFADCAAKKWPFGQPPSSAVCEKAVMSFEL